MPAFRKTRNIELSTIQFVEDQVNANWNNVSVVKSFTQAYTTDLPVISVRMTDIDGSRAEIGSDTLHQRYSIYIDVFASSDGQRLDLVDFLVENLKSGWPYYIYSNASGSEDLDRVQQGRVRVVSFDTNMRVNFSTVNNPADISVQDKFRQLITLTVEKI
jgi:hypothetical protein